LALSDSVVNRLDVPAADTGPGSVLCFRPLFPALETKMFVVWKKYQVFSPAAELLLNEMKKRCNTKTVPLK